MCVANEKDWTKSKLAFIISQTKTDLTENKDCIYQFLRSVDDSLDALARINEDPIYVKGDTVVLGSQANFIGLHRIEDENGEVSFTDDTSGVVKQRSSLWFKIRELAVATVNFYQNLFPSSNISYSLIL